MPDGSSLITQRSLVEVQPPQPTNLLNRHAFALVYVLTSASTWSGAEQFSYNLKMLRRRRWSVRRRAAVRMLAYTEVGVGRKQPVRHLEKGCDRINKRVVVHVRVGNALDNAYRSQRQLLYCP